MIGESRYLSRWYPWLTDDAISCTDIRFHVYVPFFQSLSLSGEMFFELITQNFVKNAKNTFVVFGMMYFVNNAIVI